MTWDDNFKTKIVGVRFTPDEFKKLKDLAARVNKGKMYYNQTRISDLVRGAVWDLLSGRQDYHKEYLGQKKGAKK